MVVPQHPPAVEVRTDDVENAAAQGIWIANTTTTTTNAILLVCSNAHPLIIVFAVVGPIYACSFELVAKQISDFRSLRALLRDAMR
jgi:hypothetical protein